MQTIYYWEITLAVFGFLFYLIFTDPNAAPYFNLVFKEWWVNIRRWFYIAIMYPRIKFDMWMIKRRYEKIKRDNEKR
tara:strand:+ start:486 stop:716 length:231 start_codon:yes stop_codon:yes gene_type:complete